MTEKTYSPKAIDDSTAIEQQTKQWLQSIVIGLQLCPFAKAPFQKDKIRFVVSMASREEALIEKLIEECEHLDDSFGKSNETETTLLIYPNLFSDFFDFCQFVKWAETTLKQHQWQGIYQLAHFHPNYQFATTDSDDPQNLTNRSPFPIIHILRESSLSAVLESFSEPDSIPQKNIETMNKLTEEEKKHYFYYLFS